MGGIGWHEICVALSLPSLYHSVSFYFFFLFFYALSLSTSYLYLPHTLSPLPIPPLHFSMHCIAQMKDPMHIRKLYHTANASSFHDFTPVFMADGTKVVCYFSL